MKRYLVNYFLVLGGAVALAGACSSNGEETGGTGATTTTTTGQGGTGTGGTAAGGGGAGQGGDAEGGGGSAPTGKWVSGYHVGYQAWLYPTDAIDFSGLTHLVVGAALPNADGTLDTSFYLGGAAGPAFATELTAAAHLAGKKAILMIGGAGTYAGFSGAASSAHRAAFVQNLLTAMNDLGFDGLDLDWEPLGPADAPDFTALAEALRAADPTLILTVPVGYVNANFPQVDAFWANVAPLFDQINMMTYGMADAWPGWDSWHSSALAGESGTTPTSVSSSAEAYIAGGVPAEKIGVGIGFYGSCWAGGVTGPSQAVGGSSVVASDNDISFTNIVNDYYVPGNAHYDAAAEAPYLGFANGHGPYGCTFLSYEDEQSILAKGAYVKSRGLGGAIIWTIGQGYLAAAAEPNPLLVATRQGFLE
ncbi:MAG: glycoside hydrolase family 18 protein [Myxococcales bacterium]|nr:glycoside hydrolase family 18 protein [Myxococcales bacterium]